MSGGDSIHQIQAGARQYSTMGGKNNIIGLSYIGQKSLGGKKYLRFLLKNYLHHEGNLELSRYIGICFLLFLD